LSCQHATSSEPADNPEAPPGHGEDLDGYRSLLECLAAVPEPRRRHGIRHRLAVVLAFAVAAVLAGADSITAISEWAAEAPAEVLAALGARWDRRGRRRIAPSPATFRRVLKRVDATAVAAAFGAWLAGQLSTASPDLDGLVIALDGKTMRGARAGEDKAPHLLAAMICAARAVIAQRDVDQKTNEITQVKPLLAGVDLRGTLVTADAMHVQRETARYLVEDKHADYLFTAVKDNQPGLFAALDALDWAGAPIVHTAFGRGHGRHETRTLQVLPAPAGLFPLRRTGIPHRTRRPRPAHRPAAPSRGRPGHHQPQPRTRRHPDPHRHRRPQPLGHRGPPPCTRRHDA
jgi:predicted transposase YbfD/YdcC